MSIIRTKHDKDNPYVIINKSAAEDKALSFKAVGIHTYLMTKPDNWTIREADLAARHNEGTTAVRSGLKELKNAGYIETVQSRDKTGQITGSETHVFERPQRGKPQRGKPTPRVTEDIVSNDALLVSNKTTTNGDGGNRLDSAYVFRTYESNIGMLTPMIAEMIKDAMDTYALQWIVDAIAIAVKANVRRWNYIDGILKRWAVEGRQEKTEKQATIDLRGTEELQWTE